MQHRTGVVVDELADADADVDDVDGGGVKLRGLIG